MTIQNRKLHDLKAELTSLFNRYGVDADLDTADHKLADSTLKHLTGKKFEQSQDDQGHDVYQITGLEDFLNIPPDRLEDCLADFKVGCDKVRPLKEFVDRMSSGMGLPEGLLDTRVFTWIDDGIHGEAAANQVDIVGIDITESGVAVKMSNVE